MALNDVDSKRVKAQLILEAPVAEVPSQGHWPTMLQALAIQPNTRNLPVTISPTLLEQHQITMQRAIAHSLPTKFIGYRPAFTGTDIFPGLDCDWAMMNLTHDPMYYYSGQKLIMPEVTIRDLLNVLNAGINFEAVFVAHAIPQGSIRAGQSVPLELILPPPPAQMTQRLNTLARITDALWFGVGKTLKTTASAMAAIAALPVAAAVGLASVASYDPVLLGLHIDRSRLLNNRPFAMWYYLTHWYW